MPKNWHVLHLKFAQGKTHESECMDRNNNKHWRGTTSTTKKGNDILKWSQHVSKKLLSIGEKKLKPYDWKKKLWTNRKLFNINSRISLLKIMIPFAFDFPLIFLKINYIFIYGVMHNALCKHLYQKFYFSSNFLIIAKFN